MREKKKTMSVQVKYISYCPWRNIRSVWIHCSVKRCIETETDSELATALLALVFLHFFFDGSRQLNETSFKLWCWRKKRNRTIKEHRLLLVTHQKKKDCCTCFLCVVGLLEVFVLLFIWMLQLSELHSQKNTIFGWMKWTKKTLSIVHFGF